MSSMLYATGLNARNDELRGGRLTDPVKLSKSARCSTWFPVGCDPLALVAFRVALFAAYLWSVRTHNAPRGRRHPLYDDVAWLTQGHSAPLPRSEPQRAFGVSLGLAFRSMAGYNRSWCANRGPGRACRFELTAGNHADHVGRPCEARKGCHTVQPGSESL